MKCSLVAGVVLLLAQVSWDCVDAKPPNIIFILSDDLGYGDVSISPMVNRTNEIPTPNVQRLADEGMRFLRGYSGQVCAPSRCTLMTGRHSGHCTVRGNDGSYTPLLKSDKTVARVLSDAYTTGIVGKWGLGDFNTTGYPLEQGFDYYVGQASQVACHDWYPKIIQNNTQGSFVVEANANANNKTCGDHHASCEWANDLFAREAVKFIRNHGKDEKPFFLFFSTTTPHTGFLNGMSFPYPVPAPYDSRFHYQNALQEGFASATSAQDDFVGAVLDELKGQQLDEDTIVFFSGDNGPDSHPFDFFDDPGPFRGKKRSLHEGGVRQTIVARWPGHIAANSTTDHLFAFWDFLPTAAELGGVTLPPGIDGVSAAAVLQGKQQESTHSYLYWEFCDYNKVDGLLPQQYQGGWLQSIRYDSTDKASGVRTEWKGIRSDRGDLLLYNLSADISETFNVAAKFPDIVKQITGFMDESHEEDPFWKSSYNSSDRCCSACFNHAGCKKPCMQRNTSVLSGGSRSSAPELTALPLPISYLHLAGDWVSMSTSIDNTQKDVQYETGDLRIMYAVAENQGMVIAPGTPCLHGASIHLNSDHQRNQHAVMRPAEKQAESHGRCKPLIGEFKTDGNTLFVSWKENPHLTGSDPTKTSFMWRKPGFDYD